MLECPNCRRKFQPGTHFCGSCGTPLVGTVSAAVFPNNSNREPLASSQHVAGSQTQESLDDTLMRKKPDGFSWQSQRVFFADDEPQQVATLAAVEEEKATFSLTSPGAPPASSPAPGAQAMSTSSAAPSLTGSQAVPASLANPASAVGEPVAAMSAKVPGEHLPFAIPARPGRSSGTSPIPGQSVEASEDVSTAAAHGRRPLTDDTSGNRTIVGLPHDPDAAPLDYVALSSTLNASSIDFLAPAYPTLPVPAPNGSLSQTFTSSDLSAKLAALSPSLSASSDVLVPEAEVSTEPVLPATTVELPLSVLPAMPDQQTISSIQLEELIDGDGTDRIITSTQAQMPAVLAAKIAEPVETTCAEPLSLSASCDDEEAEELNLDPTKFFAPFFKPAEVPAHLFRPDDPYLHLKQELAAQRIEITSAMDELLPLVYENHREENQALFAHILTHRPSLDDEAWGHAAFVLGAYGNYMYRHSLSFTKKLEIWRAQLWAVYYERSYRRKYLAQRCQQLLHFFQGCAQNSTFLTIALHDLETLYFYLEPGSLRKLQQMLQVLPFPPTDLLARIDAHMLVAEQEKAERMARQPAPAQSKKTAAPEQPSKQPVARPVQPIRQPAQPGVSKPTVRPVTAQTIRQPAPNRPAGLSAGRPPTQEEQVAGFEAEARKWLGFLGEEQRRLFFASLRADRLQTINQILLRARKPILTALRAELLAVGGLDYQRPRKSVPVRLGNRNNPDYDRFAEAFRLLSSPKGKEQQAALRMFEQNVHENIKQEHAQSAREWMLYARALIQGSTRVAADWERDCKKEEASWEEIWNLAYYHRITGDLPEAVRVLAPGLDDLDAPLSHLRLALICALTLLLEPGQTGTAVLQDVRDLLIRHLERWPHPLSCLAWLVLGYEHPGTLRPLDQSKRLSAFQELLEYPVRLPDPRLDLPDAQINALEDALVSKTHCEEAWFLWLNDYAARRPHNFFAWRRLAETSERMERLERAERALQHMAGIYYDLDYVYAQEGEEEMQAAEELRLHVEKLFDFYRRHEMQGQAWDSFESCYVTLKHHGFWDEQQPANRRLLMLVRPFLAEVQRREVQRQEAQRLVDVQEARARSEIRRSELSNNPTRPLEYFKPGQRVGIFVDYENIARLIPQQEEMEQVWQTLASYAAQFGEVVSRWASASPRNLSNLTAVRTSLENAQFKIRYPRRELQFSASQKDLADYALLECINNASLNDHLDVYLVVSGDRDYYERVYSLLESGRTVRILASDGNLSTSYRELEQQRLRKQRAAGREESDFFIDDLNEVLHSLPPLSH